MSKVKLSKEEKELLDPVLDGKGRVEHAQRG